MTLAHKLLEHGGKTMGRRKMRAIASRRNGCKSTPPKPKELTGREIREIHDWGFTVISYGKGGGAFLKKRDQNDLVKEVLEQGDTIFNNKTMGSGDGTRLQLIRQWPNLPGQAAKVGKHSDVKGETFQKKKHPKSTGPQRLETTT